MFVAARIARRVCVCARVLFVQMPLFTNVDDLMTNPLAMITTPRATVQIPSDMPAGPHQLILRLHDGTHRIIEPQVIERIDITVE